MGSPLPRQRSGPIVLKVSSSDFSHRTHHPALDTLSRWQGSTRFIDDDRVELHNNTVERLIRGIDPLAYLNDVLTRIVNEHPSRDIDQLLPWAYREQSLTAAA